jgi:hypothetical protein
MLMRAPDREEGAKGGALACVASRSFPLAVSFNRSTALAFPISVLAA